MFKIILIFLASIAPLTSYADAVQAPNTIEKAPLNNSVVSAPAGLTFTNPWARPVTLIPNTITNTAVYLSIKSNTAADYKLINASSDIANRTEIHQTVTDQGVSKMVKISNFSIPGNTVVNFEPGGAHIMLYDLKRSLNLGDKFKITLFFENGSAKDIEVQVSSSAPEAPST